MKWPHHLQARSHTPMNQWLKFPNLQRRPAAPARGKALGHIVVGSDRYRTAAAAKEGRTAMTSSGRGRSRPTTGFQDRV
jgi:hypothetical protein